MKRFFAPAILFCVFLSGSACSSHLNAPPSIPYAPSSSAREPLSVASSVVLPSEVPAAYRCLPSGYPAVDTVNPSLAWIGNCSVASAKESARLQELAVALMAATRDGHSEYCTGVPLSYDAATKIGFVLTAGHCVTTGRSKPANTKITEANITTFPDHAAIYQGTPAFKLLSNQITGHIEAVYVPPQYCEVPSMGSTSNCSDLRKVNGDIAVLKIRTIDGHALRVNPQLRIPSTALQMSGNAEIMALGYGMNTTAARTDRTLYYVTYQYFGTNHFEGESAELSIFTGWHPNAKYYGIICQGDSGGGDFYWDGTAWNVVGVHSFGVATCGGSGPAYRNGLDASADVRPWQDWITGIVNNDNHWWRGCGTFDPSKYICRPR